MNQGFATFALCKTEEDKLSGSDGDILFPGCVQIAGNCVKIQILATKSSIKVRINASFNRTFVAFNS